MIAKRYCIAATLAVLLASFFAVPTNAADIGRKGIKVADMQTGIQLNCDNGRSYPILAKAVSDEGELVTGYLVLAPRKHAYFRLVPMTVGYRYAGQGFWFDGIRNEGAIKGKNDMINCVVEQRS